MEREGEREKGERELGVCVREREKRERELKATERERVETVRESEFGE